MLVEKYAVKGNQLYLSSFSNYEWFYFLRYVRNKTKQNKSLSIHCGMVVHNIEPKKEFQLRTIQTTTISFSTA